MTRFIIFIAPVAVVIGLLYFRAQQREQLKRIQAAEAAAQEATGRAASADERSDKFKREMLKLQAEELMRPRATTSSNSSAASKPEHPAAKLFRDPEMRAAMKKEHERAIERSAKQLVSSNLVEQLQLTPEQAATLRELVKKKHAPGMEMNMVLMNGDLSDAELAQAGRNMRDQRNAADNEIRAFLGDDRYSVYAWQEDSEAERSRIKEFRAKLAEENATLTREQEENLVRAMYDERVTTTFTHDFHNPHNFDMDQLPEIFSEASLDQFMREMEQLNERIIVRAQSILGPEQSGDFAQSLRDHFERSKVTIKMTSALFPVRRRN
jgi:hypothetical protein